MPTAEAPPATRPGRKQEIPAKPAERTAKRARPPARQVAARAGPATRRRTRPPRKYPNRPGHQKHASAADRVERKLAGMGWRAGRSDHAVAANTATRDTAWLTIVNSR